MNTLPSSTTATKPTRPNPALATAEEYAQILAERARARLVRSGLTPIYRTADSQLGYATFERFRAGRGTYLFGLPGRGKTYAAACAVRLACEQEIDAKLITTKGLLDEVKESWKGSHSSVLRFAKKCPLLVLDDIGVERASEWSIETLTELVDSRVAHGLVTIFTSNYSLGELGSRWEGMAGMRLISRIAGSCERVEVTGDKDLRWQK